MRFNKGREIDRTCFAESGHSREFSEICQNIFLELAAIHKEIVASDEHCTEQKVVEVHVCRHLL